MRRHQRYDVTEAKLGDKIHLALNATSQSRLYERRVCFCSTFPATRYRINLSRSCTHDTVPPGQRNCPGVAPRQSAANATQCGALFDRMGEADGGSQGRGVTALV